MARPKECLLAAAARSSSVPKTGRPPAARGCLRSMRMQPMGSGVPAERARRLRAESTVSGVPMRMARGAGAQRGGEWDARQLIGA